MSGNVCAVWGGTCSPDVTSTHMRGGVRGGTWSGPTAPRLLCVDNVTYCVSRDIALVMTTLAQKKVLREAGTLNQHPEDVRSALFAMDFFDAWDRAQVKYEMLRAHSVEGDAVVEACRQFGFSRESFYQIQQAFGDKGFMSFLPGKRGRKGPFKLRDEVLAFAFEQKQQNPDLDPAHVAALIKQRYGIEIHRTTIMRGLKKKRRGSAARAASGRRRTRRSGPGDL